jgi:hypothetical protein
MEIPDKTIKVWQESLERATLLLGRALIDVEEMEVALKRVHQIVRVPSGSLGALHHFQRDFDEIRLLVEPYARGSKVKGE